MLKIHKVTQGNAWFVRIPLIVDGVTRPVQGWRFFFTVKVDVTDADSAALIRKSTDAGTILPLDPTTVYATGTPADLQDIALGRYPYDIKAVSPAGDPYTLEKGIFELTYEVTQAV